MMVAENRKVRSGLVPLGEVLEVRHGYAFKGEFFGDSGPFIVVTPGSFFETGGFRIRDGKEKRYSGEVPERFILSKNDLIVAMTEQSEGLLGSAALVPESRLYLHNQRIGLVAVNRPDLAEKRFLYYLFNTRAVRQQIRATATGAKVRHTAPERIQKVLVELPSLEQQRRIATVLSAYDSLIEKNSRRIAILEKMAQALYREWFVEFRFPGHERVTRTDSVMGRIPNGWRTCKLSELADVNARSIRRGAEPETVSYVDIASVSTGTIETVQRMPFEDAPGRARRLVKDGDTIWSCVRPNRRSFSLVLDPDPELVVSTGFAVLSPKSAPFGYIYHAVTTEEFTAYLTNHAQGAAYPAVTATTFENAVVLKPEAAILDRFQAAIEPMLRLRETCRRKNLNLCATRDLLLPKLISGEIDVSEVTVPEAADAS